MNIQAISISEERANREEVESKGDGRLWTPLLSTVARKYMGTKPARAARAFNAVASSKTKPSRQSINSSTKGVKI